MIPYGKAGQILKKFVWLSVAIIGAVAGLLLLRPMKKSITVKTQALHGVTVQETVTCKGKVEKNGQTEITLPADVVVGEVKVKEGDTVKKGDILFTVDMSSTLQALADADGAAAVQAAMTGSFSETVTAPCDGRVRRMTAREGVVLEKGETAVEVEAPLSVCVRLAVPERHIRLIEKGQAVLVSGVGFRKSAYMGTVTDIASVAKTGLNGTATETVVEAVVTLAEGEADDSLRVGLNATGTVTVDTVYNGMILPYAAVEQDEDNREYVYILRGETAEKRIITPHAERVDGYLVTDGFSEGELLILSPDLVDGKTPLQAEEETDDRTD